jgi:hypothetical protein
MKHMFQHNSIYREHEQFSELCALYPTGALSENEVVLLREHIVGCLECRDRLADYQQIVRDGMPLLAEGRFEYQTDSKSTFSVEGTKRALYAELDRQQRRITNHHIGLRQKAPFRHESDRQPSFWHLHRSRLIQVAGAIALFLCAGAFLRWRPLLDTLAPDGQFSRAKKTASPTTEGSGFNALVAERDSLNVQLKQRDAKIEVLTSRIDAQLKEISRLKETSDRYRSENEHINSQLTLTQAEQNAIEQGHSSLEAQLNQAQDTVIHLRKELGDMESQRRDDLLHSVSLETKIAQVSAQIQQQHSTINDQQSLLASDRDIRELMGARDLYIADVFDVDSNSHTQKPFGRLFYTKHKSLIFYAFDLDQQRGVKNASAFQAWGLGDWDKKHPLNLGILYLDNQANRRWVLKFEDPDVLAKINAVFVTVEPAGGSTKPSGKQFLYAYLSNQSNHP